MVGVSIREIDHLARLARIELTETEKKKYAEQISDILDYVKKLDEVNVQEKETVNQMDMLENVWREDKIATRSKRQETRGEMLKNAPMVKDGYMKVKAILNV